MIAAFARAARVLRVARGGPRRPTTQLRRRRAPHVPARTLWDADSGALLRRYRDGDAAIDGYGEDYAYLILGCSSCSRPTAIRVARMGT